jgi:MFS transporter, YNFM family, putative membrane transport protein
LAWNFYFFAAVNLAGAVLVFYTVAQTTPMTPMGHVFNSPFAAWAEHLRNPQLRAAFGIGFCILFAFIGTFTYVNFVLVRPPLSLGPMQLGFVYFVFLPSIVTTLLAGSAVGRIGARRTLWAGLALAALGLPLLLVPKLFAVLLGMVLIGVGTFFAQATTTDSVEGLTEDRRSNQAASEVARQIHAAGGAAIGGCGAADEGAERRGNRELRLSGLQEFGDLPRRSAQQFDVHGPVVAV